MTIMPFFMLASLFSTPMTVPTTAMSLLWALPISLSIAIIYKTVKLKTFTTGYFIREVSLLFLTIVGVLILVAVGMLLIAHLAHVV